MKLTDALTLQEGLNPAIVKDIVDIAMRPEFGRLSGMDKVVQKEWEDVSQLIRYIKEAIPTTTHYLFDTLVSKLEDRLPDTEFDQNLNENEAKFKRGDEVDYLGKKGKVRSVKFNPFDKSFDYTIAYIDQGVRTSSDGVKDRDLKEKIKEYGLPGNLGREFGEKYMREFITPGDFAEIWTAFESIYPELKPQLQTTFAKTNDLLKYIKPEKGDEAYRVSAMPEAAAQELIELLNDALELLEFVKSQKEQPSIEGTKEIIRQFDNTFSDMLMIFTSNTSSDEPLKPYKQRNIGFGSSLYKENKIMETKIQLSKLITEDSSGGTISSVKDSYKELQLAWRNLDNEQRFDLLLPHVKDPHDEPDMEWDELWNKKPMLANNPDFQDDLLAANFGGNSSVNEEYTAKDQWDEMNPDEKEIFLSSMNKQHLLHTHTSFEQIKSEIPDIEDRLKAEIEEGTCGYSVDGEGGDKPAGPHLLRKSNLKESEIRKMIKKQIKEIKDPNSRSTKLSDLIKEENFDKRLAQQMGMSDDEFEDKIASRDIEQPFPDPEPYRETAADKLIKQTINPLIRNMSDDELEAFNKRMVEYFLESGYGAQGAAKVWFGRKEL